MSWGATPPGQNPFYGQQQQQQAPAYGAPPGGGYAQGQRPGAPPGGAGYGQAPPSGAGYGQQAPRTQGYGQAPPQGAGYGQAPPQGGGAYGQAPHQGGGAYGQAPPQGGGTYGQAPPQGGGAYGQAPPHGGGGAYGQATPQGRGGAYGQTTSHGPSPGQGAAYGQLPAQGGMYGQGSHAGGAPTTGGYGGFAQAPNPPPSGVSQDLWNWFQTVDTDRSGKITSQELQQALLNGNWTPFNPETCRLMIGMFDRDRNGTIDIHEFAALWKYIQDWKSCFDRFDTDRSGNIDSSELNNAFKTFGYNLTPAFCSLCVRVFDRHQKGNINFDDFIQCCVMLKSLTDQFKEKDKNQNGMIKIHYEEFLRMVLDNTPL